MTSPANPQSASPARPQLLVTWMVDGVAGLHSASGSRQIVTAASLEVCFSKSCTPLVVGLDSPPCRINAHTTNLGSEGCNDQMRWYQSLRHSMLLSRLPNVRAGKLHTWVCSAGRGMTSPANPQSASPARPQLLPTSRAFDVSHTCAR